MGKILNQGELINSLQISTLKNIPEGDFTPGTYFLVKNITDAEIRATVVMAGNRDEEIETILYPGWNVELLHSIKGVEANTLQYGI